MKKEIQQIIDAWIRGDEKEAIALTNEYAIAISVKYCAHCGKKLASQAKGLYCKAHRHLDPKQKQKVLQSKKRRKNESNKIPEKD